MIQPNELRIGNLVMWGIKILTVEGVVLTSIGDPYIILPSPVWQQNCNDIEPIPLTEEWLLKAGFKKERVSSIGGQDMWAGMGAYSYKGEWLFRGDYRNLHLVSYFNTQFRYLHQLQNIFYVMYGKELEIKP